jgi:hypothetical protein
MTAAAVGSQITCDYHESQLLFVKAIWQSLKAVVKLETCCKTYHVGSEPGRCHSREVRRASVVFATTNDCYSSKLAYYVCKISIGNKYIPMDSLPLWNDSSMGGIILYTLPKSSLRDKLAAMIVDCVYYFLADISTLWYLN